MSQPPVGSTLKAWLRQGAKEAAQALQALPDSIKVVEEPGMPGNPTSYEITQERREPEIEIHEPEM